MKKIIIALCLLVTSTLQAQDPHFSQFYNSPLNTNPALTGFFDGLYRVHTIYRDQYKVIQSPYRSFSAVADFRYHFSGEDYYNFGVKFLRDKAGAGNFIRTTAHGSFSYRKQLGGGTTSHFLIGGVEFGVGQHRIDLTKLWFGEQFDLSIISENINLPSGEGTAFAESTNLYLDLGGGLSWFTTWGARKSLVIGGAMIHLNQPKVSFNQNDNVKLDPRLVFHVNVEWPLSKEVSILPSALYQTQRQHSEILLGAQLRYFQSDINDTALRLGMWGRAVSSIDGIGIDALIISGMYEFNSFQFGLSYDVTVSGLSQANNSFGGFEFSLTYIVPEGRKRVAVQCPKL
jgi:type IX secretion system PorP/SprF family membrane protein